MKVLMVPKMRDDYDVILQLASTNILKPDDMFTHPENGKKKETLSGMEKRIADASRPNMRCRYAMPNTKDAGLCLNSTIIH